MVYCSGGVVEREHVIGQYTAVHAAAGPAVCRKAGLLGKPLKPDVVHLSSVVLMLASTWAHVTVLYRYHA